jgi:hypothetical protein
VVCASKIYTKVHEMHDGDLSIISLIFGIYSTNGGHVILPPNII